MFALHLFLAFCIMLGVVGCEPTISESEIMEWKAPEYLKTKFPYYLSGHDLDGSPVFVLEAGKWDLRPILKAGAEIVAEFDKWTTKMLLRMRSAGNEAVGSPGAIVIMDIDGVGIERLGHVGVVQVALKQFPKFYQLTQRPGIKKVYVINANYLYERLFEAAKPMLGEAANLIETYGTNSAKWKPVLLKDIPAEELPAWYGGSKSHRPIQVFG